MKLLLLSLATLLFAQERPYVKDPDKLESQVAELKDQYTKYDIAFTKQEFRIQLERLFLERFLVPIDAWLEIKGPDVEDFSIIKWYLLLIRSNNVHLGSDIWIKFYLVDSEKTNDSIPQEDGSNSTDTNLTYAKRKRNSLMDVLEHHFVQLLNDPAAVITMKDGTAHLYRIPDEKFSIERVLEKPKDFLIY